VVDQSAIANRLADVKPVTISMVRPGVDVTTRYVRDRFNAIPTGQAGQRIQTAQLFTGLLKEQYAMAERGALYPFKYGPWLPELLRAALVSDSGLLLRGGGDEWVVKVNAMADLLQRADGSGTGRRDCEEPQPPSVAGACWPSSAGPVQAAL
jgi:hypothetical protein